MNLDLLIQSRFSCRRRKETSSGTPLTFQYDREADILYINTCAPYPEQESEELEDEVIARFNPATDEIENLEVLFFSTRLLRQELFQLPVSAHLRRESVDGSI